MTPKQQKTTRWVTRIFALLTLLAGLPFYFGYGNPIPFINPDYTIFDNIWLTTFPLMFIGLLLGLKYEKLGGYLVTIPLLAAFVFTLSIGEDFTPFMLVPFVVGILYLVVAYKK